MQGNLWFALGLSAVAAMATTAGCFLGMLIHRPGPRFMAVSLGFSAGVMMFVSFAELLATGIHDIGFLSASAAFFGGMGLMFLIDATVPHWFVTERPGRSECPDRATADGNCAPDSGRHNGRGQGRRWRRRWEEPKPVDLLRTGMLVALGIAIHNLPEGMATFAGAIKSRGLGLAIAAAIALHNIPEGVAVAVPVFCATGSRRKAFLWSFVAGGAELVGALLAAAVLLPFLTPTFLAITLSAVAGLMVFISFDELIPGSYAYGHEHLSVIGVIAGMALMAASIWALR